ncbi:MAG: formate dehydrogenase accessory sulfurtransferase FdhD [Halieaceae bacterium]
MSKPGSTTRGVVEVQAHYLADSHASSELSRCQVVEEDALTLDVEGVGYYTLMWTPTAPADEAQAYTLDDGVLGEIDNPETLALALGFALSEGLITGIEDIVSLALCEDEPRVVRMRLRSPEAVQVVRKDVVVNSSCGICGPREILEDNVLQLNPVGKALLLPRDRLLGLMTGMRDGQEVFRQTGGSHAAAIFDADGAILAVSEDLGRHNALDKVIGKVLLERGSTAGCGVVLSSRLSLEMVLKAVRAGLEIMLAVSAPTSLAIEVATRFEVTLAGFVRGERATLFTHPQRIVDA